MGVRGLRTFFDENPKLSVDYKLYDTKVVIDGNNLLHYLYFSENVDCIYGGDYCKFADVIRKYFAALFSCNIQPIVLFDGGLDPSDRKLATVIERVDQRIRKINDISKKGHLHVKILPILAMDVMKDVLSSINIPFAQCDFEADDQITAISNHYKCPIISQDSDFYIFDVQHGFIRLDLIDISVRKEVNDSKGVEYNYLDCSIYFIDNLLKYFPGIEKEVLPLFGTLIGNDYVHIKTFDNFYSNIKLPKFSKKLKVNQRQKKMIGLLGWLQWHSYDSVLEYILNHLKKNDRQYVQSLIQRAVDSYKIKSCAETIDSLHECIVVFSSFQRTTYYGSSLPDWFMDKSRQGLISPLLLNAVSLLRVCLPLPIEDVHMSGGNTCSQYIRQVLYGIILSSDITNSKIPLSDVNIIEYGQRNGKRYKDIIEPILKIENINELLDLTITDAQKFIAMVLGDDMDYFQQIPKPIQLLFASIRYWLRNCPIKPTQAFIYGLVLHIVYASFSDANICTLTSDNSLTKIDEIINNINTSEVEFFKGNMKKYHHKPQHSNANPMLISILHSFSELQTCVLYTLIMNDLLDKPFIKTRVHCFLWGTLLYNLTRDIMTRANPDLFLSLILGRQSCLLQLFLEIKQSLFMGINLNDLETKDNCIATKRKKRSKKNRQHFKNESIPDNQFELLEECNV